MVGIVLGVSMAPTNVLMVLVEGECGDGATVDEEKFDVGLEFTLLNVMPPTPQSPIDNRFMSLFLQSRFGK